MTDIENYRSSFNDALGKPIPLEEDLRVWLDDDLEDRRAPEGWTHMRTAREVCLLILSGRVSELSLDNDLDGDLEFGQGFQVIDFLEEMQGVHQRPLWPRDGLTLHTANPSGRDRMKRAIENLDKSVGVRVVSSLNENTQPHFDFRQPSLPNDAYWVTPGRVMAGPYPSSKNEQEAREILGGLMDAGVTCFLDLTEPGDGPAGSPLDPYEDLMREVSATRSIEARRLSGPIQDVSIPEVEHMENILGDINGALADGEVIYVHCWGGVGRTGTVVGCHLVEFGHSPDEAIERIADLRVDTMRARQGRVSPETEEQMDFIRNWKNRDSRPR